MSAVRLQWKAPVTKWWRQWPHAAITWQTQNDGGSVDQRPYAPHHDSHEGEVTPSSPQPIRGIVEMLRQGQPGQELQGQQEQQCFASQCISKKRHVAAALPMPERLHAPSYGATMPARPGRFREALNLLTQAAPADQSAGRATGVPLPGRGCAPAPDHSSRLPPARRRPPRWQRLRHSRRGQ